MLGVALLAGPAGVDADPARGQATAGGADLSLRWHWAQPGQDFAASALGVGDLDGDGISELVTSGCARSCWQTFDQGPGGVRQLFASLPGSTFDRVAPVPRSAGEPGQVVLAGAGRVRVESPDPSFLPREFVIAPGSVADLAVADLEGDGPREVLVLKGADLLVYGFDTGVFLRSAPGSGGTDLDLGQTDADPPLEVAVLDGNGGAELLDGSTLAVQWTAPIPAGDRGELADVDGDGLDELLTVLSGQAVRLLETSAPQVILDLVVSWEPVVATLADFDADGLAEIVVVDSYGVVRLLSGSTGAELGVLGEVPGYPAAIVTAELDGDPVREVAWIFDDVGRTALAVMDAELGATPDRLEWPAGPFTGLAVARLEPDSPTSVFATSRSSGGDGYESGMVLDLRGFDGRCLSTRHPPGRENDRLELGQIAATTRDDGAGLLCATGQINRHPHLLCTDVRSWSEAWRTIWYDNFELSGLGAADLDGDGDDELVAAGTSDASELGNYVVAFDADSGWLEWRSAPLFTYNARLKPPTIGQLDVDATPEIFLSGFYFYSQSSRTQRLEAESGAGGEDLPAVGLSAQALADLDLDGTDEVLVADTSSRLGVLDPALGDLVTVIGTYAGPILAIAHGDVLGDERREIVLSREDRLLAVDPENGSVLWSSPGLGPIQSQTLRIADLDDDGRNEIVVATWYGVAAFGEPVLAPLVFRDGFHSGTLAAWSRAYDE